MHDNIRSIDSRTPTFHGTDAAYILPNDSTEHSRLESQHAALVSLTHGRIIHAPVQSPQTILDIGCGTGIVTRHLSDSYPRATHIYGIDLSPVPSNPIDAQQRSNLSFIQGDIYKLTGTDSRLSLNSADLIFNRCLICGVTDWPGYVRNVLRLLKPGGWAEMHDFDENIFFSDSRAKPQDDWEWLSLVRDAQKRKGLDPDAGSNIRGHMIDAGFMDVEARQFRIPFWREGEPETRAMAEHYIGDPFGHHWQMLPPLLRKMDYSEEDVTRLQREMRESKKEEEGKYQVFTVTVGRKPES